MSTPRVTYAETERILRMCLQIMDRMGIGQYKLRILEADAGDDYLASIEPMAQRRIADLSLCYHWMELSDSDKLNSLVHEMSHLIHRRQTDVIRVDLHDSGYLPDSAYRLLWATFNRETELMVDHFASMFNSHWAIDEAWERIKADVPDDYTPEQKQKDDA